MYYFIPIGWVGAIKHIVKGSPGETLKLSFKFCFIMNNISDHNSWFLDIKTNPRTINHVSRNKTQAVECHGQADHVKK
jgi:hypothetical protein